MNDNLPEETLQAFERLTADSIKFIVKNQDYVAFRAWLRQNLSSYLPEFPSPLEAPELIGSMALMLSRSLWNRTPLPRNGYRPEPLPDLKRNDPCPCGSGRKFKQCCQQIPTPELPLEHTWTLVLTQLNKGQLKEALATKRIPLEAVLSLATDFLEEGKPGKAVALLQPVFQNCATLKGDDVAEYALNVLCSAYDDLGHWKKKQALLDSVIQSQPRSPLRSGAWQRLAANIMDVGVPEKAWEYFSNAQKDDPENASLSILEVQLLLAEGRTHEAQQRAKFWHKRLLRLGYDAQEPIMSFLADMVEDPHQALAAGGLDNPWEELGHWIKTQTHRPLPDYRCLPVSHFDEQSENDELGEIFSAPDDAEPDDLGHWLMPPAQIEGLEQSWRAICPIGKPFSIRNTPVAITDPWCPETYGMWMVFLQDHPEAWDSLEILDDLATLLYMRDDFAAPRMLETELRPVLERASQILNNSVLKGVDIQWICPENRPALRALSRCVELDEFEGHSERALSGMRTLLRLNRNDNHGYRARVINALLQAGENQQALNLAAQYPNDLNPEIQYGRVLAHYRLLQPEEAVSALKQALKRLPKVPHFLTRARVRKPKLHDDGIMLGGDDQAWLYRESMRATWQGTEGALDWLKQAVKSLSP